MTDQYTSMGKQVLRNGAHYADVCDVDEAIRLTGLLNGAVSRPARVPIRERYSMRLGDEGQTEIYEGNTRRAYLDGFDLYGIGRDGYAHWICAITDKSEIPLKLAGWHGI